MKERGKTYYTEPKPGERLEASRCPVCGASAVKPLWRLEGFAFTRCRCCGHVYQNPRPLASDLAERYDEDYKSYEIESAAAFFRLMRLGLDDLGFDGLEASLPADKAFLDLGCATGALVEHARDRGWRAVGVELCRGSAEYGIQTRGVDIRIGTLRDARFAAGSFDLVHSSHLIEHIPEPGDLVDEIARVLKPGGYCITITPTVEGLQARLFGPRWRSAIADHAHLFSQKGLRKLLEDRGFSLLKIKTWGGIAQGLAPEPIKRVLDRAAKRWGFGDVMAILARKGA